MKFLFLFLLLLWNQNLFAKVFFEVSEKNFQEFSYKDVCENSKAQTLLIDFVPPSFLDCMGKKIELRTFCASKKGPGVFLRAMAFEKNKEILCQRGTSARLKLPCSNKICETPKKSCAIFQKTYAHELHPIHSFKSEGQKNSYLECHFGLHLESKWKESL